MTVMYQTSSQLHQIRLKQITSKITESFDFTKVTRESLSAHKQSNKNTGTSKEN